METLRKEIVATKEGGAITGEERLREHMDSLYGGLIGYEGKPADTLVAYIGVLDRRLKTLETDFAAIRDGDLAKANAALKARGLPEIEVPEKAPLAWQSSGTPDALTRQGHRRPGKPKK